MESTELIHTRRLTLRRPAATDAEAIFARYSSDPEVTRYMSWATHRTVADTRTFLAWSAADWERWPAGSYLVLDREDHRLLGSTGLSFQSKLRAITGYIFARDAWGKGYATEAMLAMADLAARLGVKRLEATVHLDHRASAHVLEKAGFTLEKTLPDYLEFPNLAVEPRPGVKCDTLCYVRLY